MFLCFVFCVLRRRRKQLKLQLKVLTSLRVILKVIIEKGLSKKIDEQVAVLLMIPLVLWKINDKKFSKLNTDENLIIISCYYYEILREHIIYKYNSSFALLNICSKSQNLFDECAFRAFKGDMDKVKCLKSLYLNKAPLYPQIEDIVSILSERFFVGECDFLNYSNFSYMVNGYISIWQICHFPTIFRMLDDYYNRRVH